MWQGTRARWHYWSRHRGFLLKTCIGILALGMIIATAVVLVSPRETQAPGVDPVEQQLRAGWDRLREPEEKKPRDLVRWLRQTLARLDRLASAPKSAAERWDAFQSHGLLGHFDAGGLIDRHSANPAQRDLFRLFVAAHLAAAGEERGAAFAAIARIAAEEPPPPLANELHASLLIRERQRAGALAAMLREGRFFPDAAAAREDALRLALKLRDEAAVRMIAAQPGWLEQSEPSLQHHAGILLQDLGMQWHGLVRHRLANVPYLALLLALFATGLWYVILVQHGLPLSWRWARPALPVIAGVISVWPTLALAGFQEVKLGLTDDAPFPHDLWYYIAGVGLREELSKLALFALFLPWLLWRRTAGMALMTGAFAGLGFALEENITYYEEYGGGVALVRFLSANFLHAALTGIAAHGLYQMIRTRFGSADQFVMTFGGVVLAHGLYDYAPASGIESLSFGSLVILALVAWRFFDLIGVEIPVHGNTVAPAAIFSVGMATLVAVILILAACESPRMDHVAAAAQECLAFAPVAFIYWRRLERDTVGF